MICPTCSSHKVSSLGVVSWYIPFKPFVKKGIKHVHNPNRQFEEYKCEQGHHWEDSFFVKCHCGWETNG